ncbi:MAG TPA: TIGR04282 family arsenosugar biosynthesis glycosyltransferase [Accumulibacter sp.]|jgi:hypothetical protein|nr:TIGR04282 family arsenosugar biosynthesis glycosyltransferase [Accumulibacter sp.]HQC78937.1 TIGR04282 family arsenosugar biosynthesis glycosyltransferase [Accumulibacter sp.]
MSAPPQPIGIAILAKAPIPGLAKTRLIPRLGAAGAAALQGWLLQRAVATARAAGLGPVSLWCTPDTAHPEFVACAAGDQVRLRQQPDGDLGQRMRTAMAESPTPAGTLLIGSDCPRLSAPLLRQAATALRTRPACLVPAEDGGYVLIGLRRADGRLFSGIDWGSAKVMAQTRSRLSEIGWRWQEFPPLPDIDRPADIERLHRAWPETGDLPGV